MNNSGLVSIKFNFSNINSYDKKPDLSKLE